MNNFMEAYLLLKRRPGMYLMSGRYGELCAFLDGMDLCSGEQIMAGFRAWMINRGVIRPELSWWLLALEGMYSGDKPPNPKFFSEEDDRRAVAKLFDILDAYLSQR